jgi:hypothetical protein
MIELRSLEAEQSPADLMAIVALLKGRIALAVRAAHEHTLVDLAGDGELALKSPADDRYLPGHLETKSFDKNDASKIAKRFTDYVFAVDKGAALSQGGGECKSGAANVREIHARGYRRQKRERSLRERIEAARVPR